MTTITCRQQHRGKALTKKNELALNSYLLLKHKDKSKDAGGAQSSPIVGARSWALAFVPAGVLMDRAGSG